MLKWWQTIKHSLSHLLYPSRCLHCEELMAPDSAFFCQTCSGLFELIDPAERCPICFNSDYTKGASHCVQCYQKQNPFYRMGAAFDYMGPAASLIRKLKYANQPYLSKGMGAFLVAQLERLEWPLPDVLIPVPLSFLHGIDRGYNQSELIALSISEFLNIPVLNALERQSGDYSQAGLNITQRKALGNNRFKIKKGYDLTDRTILVIDDVMTTGSTLRKCGEALLASYPGPLYALTYCRTLKS